MIAPERFYKIRKMLAHRQPDLSLVMDNVNKAHNLSAIIRSCDAVGIHEIHAVSYRKNIFDRQTAAAGTTRWVEVTLHQSITSGLSMIAGRGMQILAASGSSKNVDFRSIDYTRPTALILGAEWDGVSTEALEAADHHISIPMHGMIESLNVSVAAAVILFEAERQRTAAGMYSRPMLEKESFDRLLFENAYPRLGRILREKGLPYPELDVNGQLPSSCHDSDMPDTEGVCSDSGLY
ncbi:tRNA (guanosine(18)-2'-O)-methyltransferase TrmH [Chlorobium phaeobacteroides]|nr:tRNA (guanosine(18)-2'-O)-methyltransferase TrmH [Chlorobium phaeobacteroides]